MPEACLYVSKHALLVKQKEKNFSVSLLAEEKLISREHEQTVDESKTNVVADAKAKAATLSLVDVHGTVCKTAKEEDEDADEGGEREEETSDGNLGKDHG